MRKSHYQLQYIWNITIDKPFKKESILEINKMIKYSFIDHKNTFYLVKERYILFDQDDNEIAKIDFNITNKGLVFKSCYVYNNTNYIKIDSDITQLKIYLQFEKIDDSTINSEFHFKIETKNYICLKYYKDIK